MAPKKIRDSPLNKPLENEEGSDECEAEAEAESEIIDVESEEPPRKKQKKSKAKSQVPKNQFKRSVQIFKGDNQEMRDDLEAQVGFYGDDGPPAYINAEPALSASEAFLAQQMEMEDYRAELEARFNEDKEKEIKKAIIKQAKKDAQHGIKLDAIEYGRLEFERKKANLRIDIERDLRPKIEREIWAKIEKERFEKEKVAAEKAREEAREEREEREEREDVIVLDD